MRIYLLLVFPALMWAADYDSGDPSSQEQHALWLINRARANPTAEGTRLNISITEGLAAGDAADVGPRPPLAMNKTLLAVARAHSQDMYDRAYFTHNTPAPDNFSPFQRMTTAGYTYTKAAENIAAHSALATGMTLEDQLMVDAGVSGRGHRINLLDLDASSTTYYREIGIGMYQNSVLGGSPWRSLMTQDFGRSATGPFLVGVVYTDTNSNGAYDAGEGVAGVQVSCSTTATTATTASAGGYTIPISGTGSASVTFAGGTLIGSVTKSITRTGENVLLDTLASEALAGGTTTAGTTTAGTTSAGTTTAGGTTTSGSTTSGTSTGTGSTTGGSSNDNSSGGCGAGTGLALVLASFLGLRRRLR